MNDLGMYLIGSRIKFPLDVYNEHNPLTLKAICPSLLLG